MVKERSVELGVAFLDGTSIRTYQKAAGAVEIRRSGLMGY